MNSSAQSKKLTILSILFVLCVLGLGYWYFFVYKCGVLPSEYEFLERFVVRNECKEREYKVKGIMYNIRDGEGSNNIVFDFNAWDTESRESLYYENIEVGKDRITGEFEVVPDNFGAVEIDLKFEKGILTLKDYTLESLSVEELKLTEEKYNEVFNTVYTAVTKNPLIIDEKFSHIPYPSEESNAVFTEVRHRDLFPDQIEEIKEAGEIYVPEVYDGYTNKLLYRPWVLSYLYTQQNELGLELNIQKEDIVNMLMFDYEKYRSDLIAELQKEVVVCEDCDPEATLEKGGKPIDKSKYQESNSFACLMIYQIFQNLNLEEESLMDKYCDFEFFESSIDSYIEKINLIEKFSVMEYVGILDAQILTFNEEDRYSPLHSSNTTSILVDTYAARKLSGIDLNQKLSERIDFVLDYIIGYGVPLLKNVCAVSYFTSLILEENEDGLNNKEELKLISNKTEEMFSPINKKIFQLMDDDMHASLLCLETNSNTSKLLDVQLLKLVNLNFFKNDEIIGIWEKKEYDARINARFLKLLMFNKEVLL